MMRWAENVARMGDERNSYRILAGRTDLNVEASLFGIYGGSSGSRRGSLSN